MEIREFTESVTEFQSSLTPFKARVLNPDQHGEEGRQSMRLTHFGHKVSSIVTLRKCAETAWRHFQESATKAMNVFQRINYETLSDTESNILEFYKQMMLYEFRRLEVIDHIYARKVKQLNDEISSMIKTMGHCDQIDLSIF